ncbi:MAG: 4Fe-4S dicluster domain-containing protein, partial [Clostridia bacterium]|nr:4Fe-4S dicluster domain-containing protein [Clostridia bacterium]
IALFENYEDIQPVILAKKYPMGGEKQLIFVTTGRKVGLGKLPADVGVVVQNVATCFAVCEAVELGKPLFERVVTVSGKGVKEPKNLWVKLGTPVKDIVDFCGGELDTPVNVDRLTPEEKEKYLKKQKREEQKLINKQKREEQRLIKKQKREEKRLAKEAKKESKKPLTEAQLLKKQKREEKRLIKEQKREEKRLIKEQKHKEKQLIKEQKLEEKRLEAIKVKKVVQGGPMTGTALATYNVYTHKTTSGILLLRKSEAAAEEPTPCLNCGMCADVCPMHLMPMNTAFYSAGGDFESAAKYGNVSYCIECGACEYICPAKRPLIQAIRKTKAALRNKEAKK